MAKQMISFSKIETLKSPFISLLILKEFELPESHLSGRPREHLEFSFWILIVSNTDFKLFFK